MIVPDCNQTYSHQTVALHLHDYAGDLWIGKNHYRVQPGDITISPGLRMMSRYESRYNLEASGSHLCIHFTAPDKMTREGNLRLPLHFRLGPNTAAARERFWRIIDHARQSGLGDHPDSPSACAASASLQELMLWLYLQSGRSTTPRRSSLVEEALFKLNQAIETSLAKPMLIGDLAAGVGLSTHYVARLFAQRYGMTLQHYLLLRRVELARHLLVSSNLLVSEIGRQVGLPDPQYFNKQFRRVVGQSPVVYRHSQARKSNRRTKEKSASVRPPPRPKARPGALS
jgi:AraC-like DNA-binding protein